MTHLAQSAPLGIEPYYFTDDGTHGPTIASLFAANPKLSRALDVAGVRQFLAREPDGRHTCFAAAHLLPTNSDLWQNGATCVRRAQSPRDEPLLKQLERAIARILRSGRRVALALSGGLDSALILRLAGCAVPVFTLATEIDGYCELSQTQATADQLGVANLTVIRATQTDFVNALPDAIAACETPLFNLHPVSKWLLARELHARGFDAMLTGDGADQVFAGSDPRNYLPIVGAMARAAGVPIMSPFLDPDVIASASRIAVDRDKTALREQAATVLPHALAFAKKTPRFCPDFDLARYRDAAFDATLSKLLGEPIPPATPSPQSTLWATLALLVRQLGGAI